MLWSVQPVSGGTHLPREHQIMKWKKRFTELTKKYKHAWVFLYIFVYMPWFLFLEKHVTTHYHVIQTPLDEYIPFVEYFIVPYLLWFVFIAAVMLYFFFTDVEGFYKLAKIMFTGMTIFLIISTIFPNGQDLRPMVYRADTCTNVFPSLHVFNSVCCCIAIHESRELQKHRAVCNGAYILATLIILATMFLKQHSVLDVMAGFLMAYVLYQFVYAREGRRAPGLAKRPALQNK